MEKRKSIEDLISSIYNLVNEAKQEYENKQKIDLNQSAFSARGIIEKELSDEFKTSSISNFESEQKKIINTENNPANWKGIEFNKNSNKASEKINVLKKNRNLEDEIIKEKFNISLNIWIENNLQRLIELEFSNYIKVRNNQ